jgi:general secretion pathway protein H
LLELILVIFMVGLIMGLITPFLGSTLDRAKGQSEVRKMASTLRYARGQAVSQKTPFIFKASFEAKQYWVIDATTNALSGKAVALGREIDFTGFTIQGETQTDGEFAVVFYPQGNSSGGSIDLQITASGKPGPEYAITVDKPTGKPHVEERTQTR